MENKGKSTVNLIAGIIIGTALGSIISLLYAPMSGRKLRKRISRKTTEVIEDVNDAISTGKEKASEIYKDTVDKANGIFSDGKKKAAELFHVSKKNIA